MGNDKGRNAWYFVKVTKSLTHFQKCIKDEIIHLEDHGEVILSAYGDEPPNEDTKRVSEEYGIDTDGNILGSVDHLKMFLEEVPDFFSSEAVLKMLESDISKFENPFLIEPTLSALELMLTKSKQKALSTKIEGWKDGDVEPYISWKISICIYTMDAPY